MIIAKKVCLLCLQNDLICERCNPVFKFYNNNDFCSWLIQQDHFIALAHNMKGYDGTFIANYCINNLTSADNFPSLLATPTKLLEIKFRKIKIIDSFSFIQIGLDKFPKTFGLKEMKKGFYPYLFNKAENETLLCERSESKLRIVEE